MMQKEESRISIDFEKENQRGEAKKPDNWVIQKKGKAKLHVLRVNWELLAFPWISRDGGQWSSEDSPTREIYDQIAAWVC